MILGTNGAFKSSLVLLSYHLHTAHTHARTQAHTHTHTHTFFYPAVPELSAPGVVLGLADEEQLRAIRKYSHSSPALFLRPSVFV